MATGFDPLQGHGIRMRRSPSRSKETDEIMIQKTLDLQFNYIKE